MAKKDTEQKNKYTDDSIITLSPLEFTRLRPATYLGSNEYSTQLVREVFSNSLDEYIIGHGNEIIITIDTKNNIYCVRDYGQGFPINVIKNGMTVLQAAFERFNTSGKYTDGVYGGSSLGLNGIGSKIANFLSKWLTVKSSDGIRWEEVKFKDGKFVERNLGNYVGERSGTVVAWQPDPQFFQNPEANISELKKLFEDISALCPNLTIILSIDNEAVSYHAKNGIQDLVDKKVKKELLSNRFCVRKAIDTSLFDICMTYDSSYSNNITAYANYGLTERGIHISTVRAGITRQINRYAFDNNLLKKNDDPLTQAELDEGLVLVFNVKAKNIKYDSQVKTNIVDLDKTLINNVINNDFVDWLNNNPKDVKIIVEKALLSRKARNAAQKAKEGIRNAGKADKKFISLPTKLVDAYSKNRSECSLYITEGDSAANGLIAKRDGKTQAIFPIRGKILSCRKATVDKIYANQEIANIVKAIGLDIDKATGKLIYDKKKLRYDKIILAADADSDGLDIRLLLINAFWWLCQDLVINGHLYVALPPLYRITTNKNAYIYLKDDKELADYKAKHKSGTYTISRNKGLGESSNDELAQCLLRPATRDIRQLIVSDAEEVEQLLETFMGNKIEARRNYLIEHGADVRVDIE